MRQESLTIQSSLFDKLSATAVVNVASVKHLSPFRYPGGKTWFVPYILKWLSGLSYKPIEFVEPFAGGAIIGLTVLHNDLADQLTLVELDADVASVWKAIFTGKAKELADRIINFEVTLDNVKKELYRKPQSIEEQAFQTILRNRVNRGGILAPGAGLLKEGEKGKGLLSRWYPETLKKRILALEPLQSRVTIIEGDGIKELERKSDQNQVVAFIDPPYTAGVKKAGNRLYAHSDINHNSLFEVASGFSGDFLMTYESDPYVVELAKVRNLQVQSISMKNTHHNIVSELVISRDMSWLK